MKSIKTFAVVSLLSIAGLAQAQTSNNISLVNNYVFRGISATDNGPALQGGIDYKNGNAYGSVWLSNVEDAPGAEGLPIEMDVTFGYDHKFSGFNLDTRIITYNYLNDADADRTEFRLGSNLTKEIEIALHREVKTNYWYPEIIFEKYLANRLYFDASIGYWNFDDADDDAFTVRAELARDFPEFHHIDVFVGVSHITDETPMGNDADNDDSETLLLLGIRKRF